MRSSLASIALCWWAGPRLGHAHCMTCCVWSSLLTGSNCIKPHITNAVSDSKRPALYCVNTIGQRLTTCSCCKASSLHGSVSCFFPRARKMHSHFRCHRKLCRQEIVSQRQDFLGNNVAPAKHVFPTPGNFVAVCVARIYCLLNMQVPMRTAT